MLPIPVTLIVGRDGEVTKTFIDDGRINLDGIVRALSAIR